MTYQITHLGAEHCVTGSCHLLETLGVRVLIDCGLTQGHDCCIPMADWPVQPADIDFLFLTHAHIDHIGRLPELIDAGFCGDIICSHPTKALLAPLLQDTMHIGGMSHDAATKALARIDDLSWGFEYGVRFQLRHGVEFTLGRAGHILGSALVQFFMPGESGRKSVVFSGDVGRNDTAILPDPDIPDSCDLLVLESTYGNRLHGDSDGRLQQLGCALEQSLIDGGKVYIPAFALGRTQEILYELDRLWADNDWRHRLTARNNGSPIPVFIDSPLGLRITEIYKSMTAFYDEETKNLLAEGDNPIDFDHLYSTARYKEHQQLLTIPGPAIIIAGSGMCSGGRIMDHLRIGLEDKKSDIIFVGYQARGTLGHDIIKYGRRPGGYVVMEGERLDIRARTHVLSGYSAHADQQELIDWVGKMAQPPEHIKLVHGDKDAQFVLAEKLRRSGIDVL